ncbi:MAG: tRNA 2-selenouridine(34) synthase MnmH [Thiobacillus sp.]
MPATPVDALLTFDAVIDVRSPSEFAEDHAPGAINLPVLDDDERARVGTLHKQVSPFDAKKIGAALVSRNIAAHLDTYFADKPKAFRPLVYCWRGGSRSGALTHILQKIGFGAVQLDGGYKAYRRHIIQALEQLPGQFQYRVVAGPTGSGKSRLLVALARAGAQVLDLEALAAHRGSLLGALPDAPQPSQKSFESALWFELIRFDPARPVFVESESKKIGALRVPDALLLAMRASPCLRLSVPLPVRVQGLIEDYAHFPAAPDALMQQLDFLLRLRGKATLDLWQQYIHAGNWSGLTEALLTEHYDPAYEKSLAKNYAAHPDEQTYSLDSLDADTLDRLAKSLLS